ncbi:MAG: DUF3667 domain-containing protein [Dokdonella sp.]
MSNDPATENPVEIPSVPPPAPAAAPAEKRGKTCANCGAPMHGPFCHACGQPEKGMIRHLASVMADVADTVFNIDSRVFRSIGPLYFRPGYLTDEYFAGRRTRYVTPFRLFFFLCVVSFFAIQASVNFDGLQLDLGENGKGISAAQSVADVEKRTKMALSGIETAKSAPSMPDVAKASLDKAEKGIRKQSDARLAYLKMRDEAKAKGEVPPPDPQGEDDTISFDGKPWDPATHPVSIGWLPVFANTKLNDAVGHAKENLIAARRDPRHLIASVFSVLPQTLFVLMPLFAVLLKVMYLFKRRLYMEHLMVALHSHAFIFMSLLLLAIVQLLIGWATTDLPSTLPVLTLLRALMWTWLPIYLFLMAKRVYRQGWFMTTMKFGFVGLCYVVMLSFGLAGAIVVGLATG